MTKYNNYAGIGSGDGVNRIAILDPNDQMTDPISGATVMREVLTVAGVTPDADYAWSFPNAVREWCINNAAVDPISKSILANSEDGKLYRWDLTTNTLVAVDRPDAGHRRGLHADADRSGRHGVRDQQRDVVRRRPIAAPRAHRPAPSPRGTPRTPGGCERRAKPIFATMRPSAAEYQPLSAASKAAAVGCAWQTGFH